MSPPPLPALRLLASLLILALLYPRHDAHFDLQPVKEHGVQEESRLLNYLMSNYDREVRPVYNASQKVVVRVGITLTQIFDMDEKNQVMTTNIWLDQEWKDEMMTWDPKDFNGITKLQIPCDKLWLPDIVLYNSADDYSKGYFRSLATVEHTGNVFWPPPTKFRSTCPVNVMYFPFDDQTCDLRLSSWMYDGTKVDVINRTKDVDLENYMPNGEWELLETRLIRSIKYYPCCPEPYPYVTVTVKIRRKTLYYMYNIVFPCMMMSTLTVLVFCMPPDSGEKIALGVTVILAFSVFMLAIAERMPETSESIPLIGIYLTFVMAMTTVSVIMTVMVLNFFYRGPVLTEVPSWARKYIMSKGKLKKTAFPFRSSFQSSVRESGHGARGRGANWSKLTEKYGLDLLKTRIIKATKRRGNRQEGNNGSIPRQSYAGPQVMPTPANIPTRDVEEDAFVGISDPISGSFCSPIPRVDIRMMDCPSAPRLGDDEQDDLVKVVRTLLDKEDQQTKDDQIRREWRMLAETVDCWLFWSFFFITTISTLLFLVILPYSHRGKFF